MAQRQPVKNKLPIEFSVSRLLLRAGIKTCQAEAVTGYQTFDSHAESKVYNFSGFTGGHARAAIDVELAQGDAF